MKTKTKEKTYPMDWLDEALTYTPFFLCSCGCGHKIEVTKAIWVDGKPYAKESHSPYEG